MDDRTTMNNKAVYHFKVFGVRAVVFMEAEIQMDDDEEHLNAGEVPGTPGEPQRLREQREARVRNSSGWQDERLRTGTRRQ
jgi:hypothetical protein